MLWRHMWMGSFPLTSALLYLGIFRFKFIHIFHITTLYAFVTFQVSASTTRFGVLIDISGQVCQLQGNEQYQNIINMLTSAQLIDWLIVTAEAEETKSQKVRSILCIKTVNSRLC